MVSAFVALSGGAAYDQAWIVCVFLGLVAATLALHMLWECAAAMGAFQCALEEGGNITVVSGPSSRSKVKKV